METEVCRIFRLYEKNLSEWHDWKIKKRKYAYKLLWFKGVLCVFFSSDTVHTPHTDLYEGLIHYSKCTSEKICWYDFLLLIEVMNLGNWYVVLMNNRRWKIEKIWRHTSISVRYSHFWFDPSPCSVLIWLKIRVFPLRRPTSMLRLPRCLFLYFVNF